MKLFKRVAKGINVPNNKHTQDFETVKMNIPNKVLLPIYQANSSVSILVKKGEKVFVGTILGVTNDIVSSNIYSSASGIVSDIKEITSPDTTIMQAVEIITDGKQELLNTLTLPKVIGRETFLSAILNSGVSGLGGSDLSYLFKLSPEQIKQIDTLIINGTKSEPYTTIDNREFVENCEDIINGIILTQKYLGIKKVIIAIERNKPEAIDIMFSLTKGDKNINVLPLKTCYPQSNETVLIEKCIGKEVPSGKLSTDIGVLVLNAETISFISQYIKTGVPLIKKRITVDGNNIVNKMNIEVLLGTYFKDVIEFCGTINATKKIIAGDVLTGTTIIEDNYPVMKNCDAILVFDEEMTYQPKKINCIRCGKCIQVCPIGLHPVEIASSLKLNDNEMLKKLNAHLCLQCGCCSFVCPSKTMVSGQVKIAKYLIDKGDKKFEQ